MNAKAVGFERLPRECLREVIGILEGDVDVANGNRIVVNAISGHKLPEPVPFVEIPSSSRSDAVVVGKKTSALVVFKSLSANGGTDWRRKINLGGGFKQHAFEWKQGLERGGQCIVLSFHCRTRDGSLKLRAPGKRTSA